jgi:hypothetical protein
MNHSYDIFKDLPEGGPIWIEVVQGLENANSRLLELCETHPGKYFIFDPATSKIVGSTAEPSHSRAVSNSSECTAFRFPLPRHLQAAQ